jgi:3-hydroxyisobutyrate dehydrogenase-like beta-hydroxyacid dehydrogenase
VTRVAFLGLGRMGAPMARRLVDAGHDVVVWNRSKDKTEGFAQVAASASKAADQAEVVITMLTDASSLKAVVYDTGLDKVMRLDGVFVDMSTVGVRAAKRLHETISRATLDAPVGGGVGQAASGELVVLAGGEPGVVERVRPVLEVFGDVVHCGGAGAGQAMKLVFNAVLAVTMSGIGEAISFGERLGLDTKLVLEVLGRSGAGAMVTKKGPMVLAADYPASFALSLMRKDAGLVGEAARDAEAWMPVATLVTELLERAEREGLGEGDYSGVTELFRRS